VPAREEPPTARAGLPVDWRGNPAIDPTANVTAQLLAAVTRLDDLRESEALHVREIMALHDEHAKELRRAEAARIDAIRTVDVAAVRAAAEVSATQATTLAAQVSTSAETLRNQVQAAATAATVALAAALDPIQKDIADLRRAQYEQQGQRQSGVDSRALLASVIGFVLFVIVVAGFIITLTSGG